MTITLSNRLKTLLEGAIGLPEETQEFITAVQSAGVSSVNSVTGAISLVAGSNVTVTPGSGIITIAASSGSSGADTTLSNLTSPTSVNQNIIFNKTSPIIQTKDETLITSQSLAIATGTGGINSGADSGQIDVRTGAAHGSGSSANSGLMSWTTGSSDTGRTGAMNWTTGEALAPAATNLTTGAMSWATGNNDGAGSNNNSGNMQWDTGGVNGGSSGSFNFTTADAGVLGTPGTAHWVTGSNNNNSNAAPNMDWTTGSSSAGADTAGFSFTTGIPSAGGTRGSFSVDALNFNLASTALVVASGANKKAGTAVLVGGTVTISNTSVTSNSLIFADSQLDGGSPGFLRVRNKIAATSFDIISSDIGDTSTVAWFILET